MEPDLFSFPRYPLLIVVSGPPGVGKDALLRRMRDLGHDLHYVVTATDRPPRDGEVHGQDYYFLTTDDFLRMKQEGELLEHAIVYDQHKGIPRQPVREALDSGKDVIMRVDVQGAATVRQIAPQAVLIFLAPASEQELLERLHRRGADTAEQLAIRCSMIREEMEQVSEFDYVVVNRDGELDLAAARVAAIIEAEHSRVRPRRVRL